MLVWWKLKFYQLFNWLNPILTFSWITIINFSTKHFYYKFFQTHGTLKVCIMRERHEQTWQNFSPFTHFDSIPFILCLPAFFLGFLTYLRIPSFANSEVALHISLVSSAVHAFFYIIHGKWNKELRKMSVSLTVMTFNLLEYQSEDGSNLWDQTKDLCVTVITKISYSPMILCKLHPTRFVLDEFVGIQIYLRILIVYCICACLDLPFEDGFRLFLEIVKVYLCKQRKWWFYRCSFL